MHLHRNTNSYMSRLISYAQKNPGLQMYSLERVTGIAPLTHDEFGDAIEEEAVSVGRGFDSR